LYHIQFSYTYLIERNCRRTELSSREHFIIRTGLLRVGTPHYF